MSDTVARIRAALLAQGFVPIAVRTRDKNPVNIGWNTRETGDANLPIAAGGLNTGIRCRGLRPLDIDVDDPARAAQLRDLALHMLGPAPIRQRANSSRLTLLYRAADGAPEKRSIVSQTFKNADGKFEKVEVLGSGQQFVAYGTHPSGAELNWTPKGPTEFPRDALTALSENQVSAFLAKAAKLIQAPFGETVTSPTVKQKSVHTFAPLTLTPEQIAHMENIARRSLQNIADAPRGTSNDTINREARTLAGLVAAGLHDGEPLRVYALEVALDRAAKGGNDPGETRRTFDSGWASGARTPWVPNDGMPAEAMEAARASVATSMAARGVNGVQAPLNGVHYANGVESAFAKIIDPDKDWINKPIPPREWCVLNRIENRQVTLFYGDGGQGKSLLALQLAAARALNVDWAGSAPSEGRTLYLSAEDDADEMHRRMDSILKFYGAHFGDCHHRIRLVDLVGEKSILAFPVKGVMETTEVYAALDAYASTFNPELIVLDVLAAMFAGNESDRPQVRQFVTLLRHIAVTHNCAVLLLAHPSMSGLSSGSGTSGSTDWSNAARGRMYFTTPTTDAGEIVDKKLRLLKIMKINNAEKDETYLKWTNGAFAVSEEYGASSEDNNDKADEIFLELVKRYFIKGLYVSPNRSASFAPTVFARDPFAAGIRKDSLERAMHRLLDNKQLTIRDEGRRGKPRQRLIWTAHENMWGGNE